ncbi:type I interferon 2 [Pelobates cultripes]|uniref:Type I interferon 2 n=1 Tax=Pelobates cultripes TaxID=61616 RepID=A0AAD1SJY3_PELCU|nr:type I interferon 2 [Pelobates cultripes]
MTCVVLKTFLILSSLVSLIYSQNCKWLRPQQENLNKGILQSFNQMRPLGKSSGTCPQNTTMVPNIDDLYNISQLDNGNRQTYTYSISQVEEAAIAARDVTNQTIRFYKRNHQKFQCDEKAWERMEKLLDYQQNLLDDCIPEGAENPRFQQNMSEYFILLQKIVNEEVDTCACTVVQVNIKRNLQLAALLSSRMRRKHLLKNIPML